MADLGNLYFDILFRDKTAEQRKKLKAEITKDLQAKLDVGFDKKKLVGDMKTLLQSEKFKISTRNHRIFRKKVPGYLNQTIQISGIHFLLIL